VLVEVVGTAATLANVRGVDGGLTVLPDPGRSERPAIEADLSVGILVMDSVRLLEWPSGLTVTSSLELGLGGTGMDLGRTLERKLGASAGVFSFRIGEPRRVGPGIDDECLWPDKEVRKGVLGDALPRRPFGEAGSGVGGVCGFRTGTLVGTLLGDGNGLRSLKEERRFLRRGRRVMGGTSPIVSR
jgi:hypothetical protein